VIATARRFSFHVMQPAAIAEAWRRVCRGIEPTPAIAFGPEWAEERPRAGDGYALILDDHAIANGRACGDEAIGLLWVQKPCETTRVFGFGLFPEYRGYGVGPLVRDAIYTRVFENPAVRKLESCVYTSNPRSLATLHGERGRSLEEGRQRATIQIDGIFYDRVLFGITREEWERICAV